MATPLLRALAGPALALVTVAVQASDPSASLFLGKAREAGFRPEPHDGKALYCRTYQPLGSHLYTHECLSESDLKAKWALERPGPGLQVLSGPSARW
jgi:hypothetical protein